LLIGFSSIVVKEFPRSHIFSVRSVEECISFLSSKECDLLILDIDVGDGRNIAAIDAVQRLHPKIPILSYIAGEYLFLGPLLRAGARGVISKKSTAEEIRRALSHVSSGDLYLAEDVQESLLKQLVTKSGQMVLTHNQRVVAQLLVDGKSYGQIAFELGIKRNTVGEYKRRIFQKLGINSIVELSRSSVFS
jgi:two-component system invasion response regulator UvrY